MKNNLLRSRRCAVVVMLASIMVAMFGCAQQAKAQTKYDLTIAGTQVTSSNCKDLTVISGVEGTVKYEPENNMLILKNAKINGGSADAIYSKIDGLKIHVLGKNQLRSNNTSTIQLTERMIMTGSGTLNVENANGDAIFANAASLIVDACTVIAKGGKHGIVGKDGKHDERLTIKYATVRAEGKEMASMGNLKGVSLIGCKLLQPQGAAYDSKLMGMAKNGSLVKEEIVIDPTMYQLWVAGKKVTLDNCKKLSSLEGVEGNVQFDPQTRILTLENATITTDIYYGIQNFMDGVTIKLVGTNSISSKLNNAIYNNDACMLTISGNGATLNLQGSVEAKDKPGRQVIQNHGIVKVVQCTIEGNAGVNGLSYGEWVFDRCNVKVKAGGDAKFPFAGSISYMEKIPTFSGCSVVTPKGTQWKEFNDGYGKFYALANAGGKVITDLVEIKYDPTGISATNAEKANGVQNIYTIDGMRVSGKFEDLPKGVYIVNGKKQVKM